MMRRSRVEAIPYTDGETALNGQLVPPEGKPRGAVVMFPTIMNQKQNVVRRLPMLAEAGYVAFLADLYGREPADRADAFALGSALREDVGLYRARIRAAVDTLAALSEAAGLPLAAIGYCMGGQAALEAARMNLPLVLAASFHGILTAAAPATEPIRPRILVCHGDADPMVPREQVGAFQAEMDAAGANWHLHVYSGVKHGFTDPEADSHGLPAIGYNVSADRQSWAAMLGLLGETVGCGRISNEWACDSSCWHNGAPTSQITRNCLNDPSYDLQSSRVCGVNCNNSGYPQCASGFSIAGLQQSAQSKCTPVVTG